MTRRRRTRAFVLAASFIVVGASAATLAGADPKGAPQPANTPARALPPQAQEQIDKWKGPDGRIDPSKVQVGVIGPDGQPIRNPDGSIKKINPSKDRPKEQTR